MPENDGFENAFLMPAWIMKYYILDLSPHNSMVKYLVEGGFTVFMISWRNPSSEHRDLGMDDYLELGINSALRVVKAVVPNRKVHAVGYCLGGTLLAIAAAALSRDGDDTLKTLTLLIAQTDFTEAGELMMLVRESGLSMLESMMWDQGFLDTKQMAGAFQILRSNDLVWSRLVREYMLGERSKMVRHDGLERRRNADALPHALGISAQALSGQRTSGWPVSGRSASRDPERCLDTDLCGGNDHRSRRAVAVGLQAALVDRCRRDVRFDDRRS